MFSVPSFNMIRVTYIPVLSKALFGSAPRWLKNWVSRYSYKMAFDFLIIQRPHPVMKEFDAQKVG